MTQEYDIQSVLNVVKEEFPQALIGIDLSQDVPVVKVRKEFLLPFCRFLHDDPRLDFDYLSILTALDYPKREYRFEVVYQLYSVQRGYGIRLKVPVKEEDPSLDSVVGIWNSAVLLEMEVFDMFGLSFNNHPDMRRIFMADDWVGHPLRKDYPLRGYKS